jgi:hypothetical protein
MDVLREFIHISDLHFAEIDRNGDPIYDPSLPATWSRAPWLKGMVGHHQKAISELAVFFRNRHSYNARRSLLIVTGDLTCIGRETEFAAVRSYLESGILRRDGGTVGLGVSDWRERTILGNHDFWPGAVHPWSTRNEIAADICRDFPCVATTVGLGGGLSIRFIRINSDDEVWTKDKVATPTQYVNRVAATGSFVEQLRIAKQKLDELRSDSGEIRVLLLHHSREIGSAIDQSSQQELDDFIVSRRVSIILTGHVHLKFIGPLASIPPGSGLRACIEARCGTTTHATQMPNKLRRELARTQQDLARNAQNLAAWATEIFRNERLQQLRLRLNESLKDRLEIDPAAIAAETRRRAPANILLVHTVVRDDDRVYWCVKPFELCGDGFLPMVPGQGGTNVREDPELGSMYPMLMQSKGRFIPISNDTEADLTVRNARL